MFTGFYSSYHTDTFRLLGAGQGEKMRKGVRKQASQNLDLGLALKGLQAGEHEIMRCQGRAESRKGLLGDLCRWE